MRVVTIADSKELCGGTHVKNTRDIERFAIKLVESKGSNVYRIELVTKDRVEKALLETTKPYTDEIVKLLMKAKNILNQAKEEGITLSFDVDITNDTPFSYKDIIYIQNELEYVQDEVKELEKTYQAKKQEQAKEDLTEFLEKQETINEKQVILMKTEGKDFKLLKGIVDELLNRLGNGFIFIANVNGDNINFIARSNIELSAGEIVKMAATKSLGNGGGSNTFAQGAGKTSEYIDEIIESIKTQIK